MWPASQPATDLGLEGKVCIVTGASAASASEGHAACAARARGAAGRARRVRRRAGRGDLGGEFVWVDLTVAADATRIVDTCAERFGAVDALVNNAGTSFAGRSTSSPTTDWQGQWELNVMGRCGSCAPPRRGWPRAGRRIVNVCSSSGKRPSLTNVAYSVTKAAQLSLSRTSPTRWVGEGVLVNAVAPGAGDLAAVARRGRAGRPGGRGARRVREEALAAQQAKVPLAAASPSPRRSPPLSSSSARPERAWWRGRMVGRRRHGADHRLRASASRRPSSSASGGAAANVRRRNGAGGCRGTRGKPGTRPRTGRRGDREGDVVDVLRQRRPEVQPAGRPATRSRQPPVEHRGQRVAALAQRGPQAAQMPPPGGGGDESSAASCSGPETNRSSTSRAARSRAPAAPRAPTAAIRRPARRTSSASARKTTWP